MSTSVAGLSNNFFPDAENGFTTTLASTISSGATTVPLNSVAGYTNASPAVFVVDPSDASKKQTLTGVIDTSGVQLTSVVWTAGTNQSHSGGATVVDYATATHIAMIQKGLLQQHSQGGAHTAVTATSLATTGNISSSAGTINAATVGSLQDFSVPLTTYRTNYSFDFVASGFVWAGDGYGASLNGSMTTGGASANVCYINGRRIVIANVTAHAFTASKDTYIDVLDNANGTGTIVYTEVANNAASSALAANSLRLCIMVSGANIAAVGSVNQGDPAAILPLASSVAYSVTDSLGNLIFPTDPQRKLIGYRQISVAAGPVTVETDVPGLLAPAIIPAGRKIKITCDANLAPSSTDTFGFATIKEGSTYIKGKTGPALNAGNEPIPIEYVGQPSAGLHTYKIAFQRGGGTGNVTFSAAAAAANTAGPTFIKIELE